MTLSKIHSELSPLLEAFYQQIKYYAGEKQKNPKARNGKGKVFKSVTWRNGVRTVAGKGGIRIPKRKA